jgi:hypothetical protein
MGMHRPVARCRILAMRPPRACLRAWLIAVACMLIPTGCQPKVVHSEKPVDPVAQQLAAIGNAYRQFTDKHGKPPKGPADIQKWLPTENALISSRDKKPLRIFWGTDIYSWPAWAVGRPVLGLESVGLDGCRFVLSCTGNVELLSEKAVRDSGFPSGENPPGQ